MMLSMINLYDQNRNDICLLCSNTLSEIKSYPNVCEHLFHYKCLRNYADNRLEKNESIICPICNKIFHQIANRFKKSKEVLFQNVILSNDETQCCICFSKYKCPVASTDTCTHTFCFECIKKWCTFKHECPMDRMPIKLLLMSDFPGGHITKKEEPPPIEQDLNGDGDNDEILNTTCEICNLGDNDNLLLLCDNCNRGYHIYCLNNPLSEIPEGDWFCDECSNDMGVNNQRLPRGIRGLHRVIDDLQTRYDSATQRGRTVGTRRTRTRDVSNLSSDDSDWSLNDAEERPRSQQVGPRTRRQASAQNSRDEVLRRSRRQRVIPASDEETAERPVRTLRQDSEANDGPNSDELLLSRSRARLVEESEEEEELVIPRVRNRGNLRTRITRGGRRTRNSDRMVENESSDREELEVSSRNRQGSLSSEPESEIEPARKRARMRKSNSSKSSGTSEEEEMSLEDDDEEEDEEEDEEDEVEEMPVITRKRTRNTAQDDQTIDDDCPLPRPVKKPRMIDESSDESEAQENTDESSQERIESRPTRKTLVLPESGTSEEDNDRERHISTSSSLSTIPCRITSRKRNVSIQPTGSVSTSTSVTTPTRKRTVRKCTLVEDIFSDSSTSDSVHSDYEPDCETTPKMKPSTSTRASTSRRTKSKSKVSKSKKKPTTTKKSLKTKRKKTSRGQAGTSRAELNELIGGGRLSLYGREKQLPVVSDDELRIKRLPSETSTALVSTTRTGNSGGSILSEINESQNNFRYLSLSTITRMPDGTLVHKMSDPHSQTSENKDPQVNRPSTSASRGEPQLPPHNEVHPALHRDKPHNSHRDSKRRILREPIAQSASISSNNSSTHPPLPSRSTANDTATVSATAAATIILQPSSSATPSKVATVLHINDIQSIIRKFLRRYIDKAIINEQENQSLFERITEKIMQRNNQRKPPSKSSVKEFTKKYVDFHLKKRKT